MVLPAAGRWHQKKWRVTAILVVSTIIVLLVAAEMVMARNYVVERTEQINGHMYKTRWDQPWYRVHHDEHLKVG
jgi:putative effector of murein hydrolase LrgA (UPF0299 family)